MPTTEKPRCFVIMPIGEPSSHSRARSDQVLKYVFEEALSDQYEVKRADGISEPGIITSQILRALQDFELVIADLSEHNANVFYELAVRHAIEKPVIHVIDSRWNIPFDVAQLRTIVFDYTVLSSVAEAKKQLRDQAAEIQSGKWGETPIKLANIMRPSKQDSEDTVLLKQAVQDIAQLSNQIERMQLYLKDDMTKAQLQIMSTLQHQLDYMLRAAAPAPSASNTWGAAAEGALGRALSDLAGGAGPSAKSSTATAGSGPGNRSAGSPGNAAHPRTATTQPRPTVDDKK